MEDTLLIFLSYLARQGLSQASIKVYLSVVRNMDVSAGLHEEFSKQLTPRLELAQLRNNPCDRSHGSFAHCSPYFSGTGNLNLNLSCYTWGLTSWMGTFGRFMRWFLELVAAAIFGI